MYASGVAMRGNWWCVGLWLTVLTMAASTVVLGQQQTVHRYKWEVQYFKFRADCNLSVAPKDVLGVHQILPVEIPINNFPGPTVRARQGDRIEVTVTNNISKVNPYDPIPERVSIHWHGIRQRGTPWSDGAAGLTEAGIPHGKSRLYSFTVDRAGTYFWHGHAGAQRAAGLYGLLIVDERLGALTPSYDGIFELSLTDWWHTDIYNQTHGLQTSRNWTWVGNPTSLLLRGSSTPCQYPYSCPVAELQCSTRALTPLDSSLGSTTGSGILIWNVLPGKTYLVRLASATSSSYLNFLIESHTLTLLEADGHLIQAFNTSSIDILPGQTYSFTFSTKADYPEQRLYHIGVNARDRLPDNKSLPGGGTDPGVAVLSYNLPYVNRTVNSSPTDITSLWSLEPQLPTVGPRFNDSYFGPWFASQIRALPGRSFPVPMVGSRNFSFLIRQIKVVDPDEAAGFRMRWTINNLSYDTLIDGTFLLQKLVQNPREVSESITDSLDFKTLNLSDVISRRMENLGPEAIQKGWYSVRYGEIVTVVLQNTAMYNQSSSEAHPWHLHGFDFWVLGYGSGLYDPESSPSEFNLVDPPVRNTVALFPLGWVAVRFIADNRGVFSFHCHNEWHMAIGMMVVFAVDVEGLDLKQIVERY